MPLNSAASVTDAVAVDPEAVMSKDEYWQTYKGQFYNGKATRAPDHYNDLNYRIAKFFGNGAESGFESAYEAYLNNVNVRNEQKAVQSARAYDEFMSNSAYSRGFADLERAGVNPYLLLNSGSTPSTSVGSSSKPEYKYSHGSTKDTDSKVKGRDFALVLLAIARLAAAL